MTGIAALAAAAAATSKIASPVTSTTPSVAAVTMASTSLTSAAGQTIKVVQAGGNLMSTGTKSSKSSFQCPCLSVHVFVWRAYLNLTILLNPTLLFHRLNRSMTH